ncbi:FdtA/QdtA family cupin domain-containing protein [Sphingomonas sp. LR60]|uniref:sugar 3,4-ketoisomerase n=1 Tax=Sphingomonas sp. LR60 TaxID=3050233 RepID=UPI002FE1DB7A
MSVTDCRLLDLPHLADSRGDLSFVEGGRHVPFDIRRVYYLYGMPQGAERGAHGHRALEQLIVPLAGSFEIELDDGRARRTVRLDHPARGLYVCPMIWRDLRGFSKGAVALVLASLVYDEADYFRDYDCFLEAVAKR